MSRYINIVIDASPSMEARLGKPVYGSVRSHYEELFTEPDLLIGRIYSGSYKYQDSSYVTPQCIPWMGIKFGGFSSHFVDHLKGAISLRTLGDANYLVVVTDGELGATGWKNMENVLTDAVTNNDLRVLLVLLYGPLEGRPAVARLENLGVDILYLTSTVPAKLYTEINKKLLEILHRKDSEKEDKTYPLELIDVNDIVSELRRVSPKPVPGVTWNTILADILERLSKRNEVSADSSWKPPPDLRNYEIINNETGQVYDISALSVREKDSRLLYVLTVKDFLSSYAIRKKWP